MHGLYKPDSREIIIHNKNFKNDNEMMYTAIHEYAHHLQFTTAATPISVRTHTTAFWNLLHTLLFEAEEKGIYTNPFESIEEFRHAHAADPGEVPGRQRRADEGARDGSSSRRTPCARSTGRASPTTWTGSSPFRAPAPTSS